MTSYNKAQRAKAIQYLRSRGIYIADVNCKWRPRPAAATDVSKTWEEFRASKTGVAIFRGRGK